MQVYRVIIVPDAIPLHVIIPQIQLPLPLGQIQFIALAMSRVAIKQ